MLIDLSIKEIDMIQLGLLSQENWHLKQERNALLNGHPIIANRNKNVADEYRKLIGKLTSAAK